jgi:hypothetical protein
MKPFTSVSSIIGTVLLIVLPTGTVLAQTDADQARVETVAKNIDKDMASKGSSTQGQVLSKEFNVTPKTVEDLRAKQGWGGVTIELAMAQHLTQTDPKTYPTMTAALQKLDTLRAEKEGWGKIAKDLGFKLGPVVSAAEHTRIELNRDLQAADRPAKIEKVERVDRPDRPQRPERPERVDRPHR